MAPPADSGEHRVANALREALPTRRHGEMLFDAAAEALGPAARVEVTPDGNKKVLYRLDGSDPRWVIPWPLLTLDKNPRWTFPMEIPGLEPAPPPPPLPGKAPNLRGLGPGYIQLQDGTRYIQVAYAEDGRSFETSRGGPPSALEGVLPILADGVGPAAERLAAYVVGLVPARAGPLRIFLPDPGAWSAWGAWFTGLPRLRAAVARGEIPSDARWAVIDPVDGSALAWGATRDEALGAWRAEVARVRPGSSTPPPPERPAFEPPGEPELPPPPDDEGNRPRLPIRIRFEINFGGGDPALPQPAPAPPPAAIIPAVVIQLPALPPEPAPIGAWRRFLSGCGATVPAAYREEAAGWTLIGKPALDLLGAPDAEAALDEAQRAHEAFLKEANEKEAPATPETAWTIRIFDLLDESTGLPRAPTTRQAFLQPGREIPILDGDIVSVGAARLRKTKP
jgi:hypothetical protein